ncbi:unnamed protein product [Ilex paraguariensis]|uniref:Uncharacterized protein n=1 Tax=Ilex paraguariensis TaxID=185542 RepID=A0ABC8TBB9_9AQUA
MEGYTKIKLVKNTKSRSIDISDFSTFPQTPKFTENTSPNHTSKIHETKQIKTTNTHISPSNVVEEHGNGERFGMKLSRNSSVSSTSSHIFRFDKQNTTPLQSAVKKAFSMRRSSSVSEGYCRIHNQFVTLASPTDDDFEGMDSKNAMQTRSVKKMHRSGRILKACKSFFGL